MLKKHIIFIGGMATSVEQLEFSVDKEWQQFARENPWACFIPETALSPEGLEYIRKKGSKIVYRKAENGYVCSTCGSEILAARVAHPIWDGPFPCSGSGRCHNEDVPYCPKCEKKPDFSGIPISVGPKVRM
jgi:DNA-directed RNA polymerase subunit RPC12/RpoP